MAGSDEPHDPHAHADIHQRWIAAYRMVENQEFYEMAFDAIARHLQAPSNSMILDAGCGSCAKSLLLAARGFRVTAVDYSAHVLELAAEVVRKQGFVDRISLQREDLTGFSFTDRTFDFVLCWGVLMHIPNLQGALKELTRVVRNGGWVVISESNMYSIEAVAMRWLKKVLGMGKAQVTQVREGIEYLEETAQGTLLTRQTDIPRLIEVCEQMGLKLQARVPGQLSELYAIVRWGPLRHMIHAINAWWFCYVRLAGPAVGNILFFRRESEGVSDSDREVVD